MPIPEKAKPISPSTMGEEVYSTLLSWITEGELRPGERLLDTELAENLGVSRTPVREALRRLTDKGLVETSASRWTRVTHISMEEAESIYPIIWKLEELAASFALPFLTESDLERMSKANINLGKAINSHDPVKASRADARFHSVLIERSRNRHLIDILDDLKIKYRRLEVHYFEGCSCASESVDEHEQILKALRDKDLKQAEQMILFNWQSSLKRMREAYGKLQKNTLPISDSMRE